MKSGENRPEDLQEDSYELAESRGAFPSRQALPMPMPTGLGEGLQGGVDAHETENDLEARALGFMVSRRASTRRWA